MGIASMVLGIIAILISAIPAVQMINAVLFFIVIGLAIADMTDNNKTKNYAVAGIVLVVIACIITGVTYESDNENINTSSKATKSIVTTTKSKEYALGEKVKVNNWEITVLGSEDKKTLKNSYSSKTTENNYVVVKMKIKNLSNEANSLLTTESKLTSQSYSIYTVSELELYDGKSKYTADYNLESYVNKDFNTLINTINPNTSITYYAVFETDKPTSEKDYKLKLKGNNNILLNIK